MNFNQFSKRLIHSLFVFSFVACFPMFVGCPDYSHQREVPDYSKMTDQGVAEGEPEK